jgi:hypothetical protein
MFTSTNDFPFITLNATQTKNKEKLEEQDMKEISTEAAREIAVEFLKQRKKTEKIEISTVEQKGDGWIVRGTCPIDLEGHPWAEKFEVFVDQKGKIKSTDFALL